VPCARGGTGQGDSQVNWGKKPTRIYKANCLIRKPTGRIFFQDNRGTEIKMLYDVTWRFPTIAVFRFSYKYKNAVNLGSILSFRK
jgi:hypothetical protein